MAIQDVVRWLLPKDDQFFDFMERQTVAVHEAALVLATWSDDSKTNVDIRRAVQDIEHKGDAIVHEVEDALARTFVTPIDREDIHKLSNLIDDILDLVNLTARSSVLYGVEKPTPPMVKLIGTLVDATAIIKDAMPSLRKHDYAAFMEAKRSVVKMEKESDTVFREAVSNLFRDPSIDAKVLLREKEVLEDLERAVDQCEDVAEFLTNLAVKNG
ncbi:MAG: DUF47 family protein [Polyangiaceae bacterium]